MFRVALIEKEGATLTMEREGAAPRETAPETDALFLCWAESWSPMKSLVTRCRRRRAQTCRTQKRGRQGGNASMEARLVQPWLRRTVRTPVERPQRLSGAPTARAGLTVVVDDNLGGHSLCSSSCILKQPDPCRSF